jgi:hypothetical protein
MVVLQNKSLKIVCEEYEVMEKVLYEDIPTVTGMKSLNVPVLKRILCYSAVAVWVSLLSANLVISINLVSTSGWSVPMTFWRC